MIGTIRILQNGQSKELAQVDLIRFNEEAIRQRLVEKGYSYDSQLVITEIVDWGVATNLTFQEIELLKLCLEGLYDNDEYIIVYLLKRHWKVKDIVTVYYRFASQNEVEALCELLKDYDNNEVIHLFYQ
ncbi:TPA: hypothetical protein ACGO89_002011, partial [Streptococcus suis]